MYPTFWSFRCCSIFSCSSLFFCMCCCKFLISACLLSISAIRFFSSFSIFSFFRASLDASFWCSWISCWSYNNREDKSLSKFCCLLFRKTRPLTSSSTMLDFETNSFYTTVPTATWNMPDLLRSMFCSSWTKNPARGKLFNDDKNLLSTSQFSHTEGLIQFRRKSIPLEMQWHNCIFSCMLLTCKVLLSEHSVKINLGLMLYCKDFYFDFSISPAETLITLIVKERGRCQTSVHFHNCSQSFRSQSSSVGTLKEKLSLIFNRLSCDFCSLPPQKCDGAESAERRHRGVIHMEILSSARDQQLQDVLCLKIPLPLSSQMKSCQNWLDLQQDLQKDIVI